MTQKITVTLVLSNSALKGLLLAAQVIQGTPDDVVQAWVDRRLPEWVELLKQQTMGKVNSMIVPFVEADESTTAQVQALIDQGLDILAKSGS